MKNVQKKLKNNGIRLIGSVVIVFILIVFACSVQADNGYVLKDSHSTKATDMPVCRELHKILNLPENANTIGYTGDNGPIMFPERYKNFKEAEWKTVSLSDVEKEIDKNVLQERLDKERKHASLDKWDDRGDFIFEKARVNFDNTGNIITLLRFRLPTWKQGSCLISNDAPPDYSKNFNLSWYSDGRFCVAFTYGGRFYLTNNDAGTMSLFRPKALAIYAGNPVREIIPQDPEWKQRVKLYNEKICAIDNPHALKEYHEYMKQQGKE